MLMAALAGVAGSHFTGSAWAGLAAAVVTGLAVGGLQALANVRFKANQVIVGFGINLLGLGLTPVVLVRLWGSRGRSDSVAGLPPVHIPGLAEVPWLGRVLDGQTVTFFLMLGLLLVIWVGLQHTPLGLRLRMAGEHSQAAATAGVNVSLVRAMSVLAGCALCGLAGADLSLGQLSLFGREMTAGRGFLAVGANVVGGWQPLGSVLASLLFGAADALQLRLQGGAVPNHFVQMIPYLVTILVVSGLGGRRPPRQLGVPYDPEGK
jgi:simple sugar transport system permease protein